TTSPTSTGSLNVNELTATVATRPRAMRAASTPPAMSTCDMIQPPKMSPCWLTSAGIGTTRSTGSPCGSAMWRDVVIARGSCGGRAARLVAQLAAEDLADIRLRQLGAELDIARHLVARQPLAAEAQQVLGGERGIALDREELDRLAGLAIGRADDRALEDRRVLG